MEIKKYMAAIEAVLFASGEPVETSRLAQVLELDEATVCRFADDLMSDYNTRGGGISMVKLDNAYQFCSNRNYADYVRKAMEIRRNTPLSQAAMEVLSVIAYNQPVTKGFVERVRGVDSSSTVNTLVERGLLEEAGRIEVPGRPVTYRTTTQFLRCFGLQSIADLPPLPNSAEPTMFDLPLDFEAAEDPDTDTENIAEETLETIEVDIPAEELAE